ncbi:MAG: polysaccharide deacetylase family protein [Planctomycetota bacterium]
MIRLLFHGIGEPERPLEAGEDAVWVDRASFTEVLDAMASRPGVAISFDDGNLSDLEIAAPELEERGLRGTFFVLRDHVGKPGYLDEAALRELVSRGHSIGSHGVAHLRWPELDDDSLRQELGDSRGYLEDLLGHPVAEAGIPFGAYDRRVLRELRAHGYERVFSSDGGIADPGAFLQPRVSVRRGQGAPEVLERIRLFESFIGGLVRRAKNLVKRLR